MTYVASHLLPGETILWNGSTHWKVYLAPLLLSLFVFVPLMVLAFVSGVPVVAIAPNAVIVILFGIAWLKRRSSEFAVTNKRVVIKVGVLQTRSIELQLSKVEAVTVNQGLAGKLFGFGEIVITGSGGTKEQFAGIASPIKFRQAVQSATDALTAG
jgi:uncharacterized membrane protein YdbT with pleckstrin-like domain